MVKLNRSLLLVVSNRNVMIEWPIIWLMVAVIIRLKRGLLMGSKRKRNKHRHITDAEAEAIAKALPHIKGACYMCHYVFVPGDQVTMTDLKGVNGLGVVEFCSRCAKELKANLEAHGSNVPWVGEELR